MARTRNLVTVASALLAAFLAGCNAQQPGPNPQPAETSSSPPAAGHGHEHGDHDHSAHEAGEEHEGPHGGHVIELGRNHEYHAEVVESETQQLVTVYILGKDMKELAIAQETLTMNLTVDGEPKSFELRAANPTDGKASRFDATDKSLFEALHGHDASGKLRVTIDGTPYVADVGHHHHGEGHEGHDHEGHDH